MGNILNTKSHRLILETVSRRRNASRWLDGSPLDRATDSTMNKIGRSATFTSGPAAMLHNVAPGRGGGSTYATPPRGHNTIWFAVPPTCRQAIAWPNSCRVTIRNNARYSATFQPIDEYRVFRLDFIDRYQKPGPMQKYVHAGETKQPD